MLAKFHLNYKALWGQTVCLLIYKSDVDFFEHDMFCVNEAEWIIEIPIDNTTNSLHYRYAVKEESKNLNFEFDVGNGFSFCREKSFVIGLYVSQQRGSRLIFRSSIDVVMCSDNFIAQTL